MTDESVRAARGMNDEAPPEATRTPPTTTSTCPPTSACPASRSCHGSPMRPRWPPSGPTWPSSARRSTTRSATAPAPASARAPSAQASYHSGAINSLQLGIEPYDWLNVVDAGDAPVTPMNIERGHEVIERKVARGGARRARSRSSSAATTRSPSRPPRRWRAAVAPRGLGIVHFDAHADAANSTWGNLRSHGTPMRRLIESGAVAGPQLRADRPARLLAGPPRRWTGCASRACAGTS